MDPRHRTAFGSLRQGADSAKINQRNTVDQQSDYSTITKWTFR